MPVDKISPVKPLVRSPIKIDRPEFTVTLPSKIVQSKRLPLLRNGRIFSALFASISSCSLLKGPFVSNSKFLTSNPNKPKLRPENSPDKDARNIIVTIVYHVTGFVSDVISSGSSFINEAVVSLVDCKNLSN